MRLSLLAVFLLAITLSGCNGNSDRGHYSTPSDPNEQQGNPNAKPEKSLKRVDNSEPDANKASKDPHTLTPDHTAGQPPKR